MMEDVGIMTVEGGVMTVEGGVMTVEGDMSFDNLSNFFFSCSKFRLP
jgi:hypothetical protein